MRLGIHVHCIKDDCCLEAAVRGVEAQCQRLGHVSVVLVSVPDFYWSGKPTPTQDLDEIVDIAQRNQWNYRVLNCGGLVAGTPGWKAETILRNTAIDELRALSCEGILIVDADELWYPDSLQTILDAAKANDVVYQSTVPVVGVPGYPIEGARDRGVAYLGPGVRIQYVRAAWMPGGAEKSGLRWTKVSSRYFHFTLVRSTVPELVQKIKDGTHYGDQYYEFDRWIESTLPRIRPGARDVSFYEDPAFPDNFWPLVRDFTAEEWGMIPNRLKPMLAPPGGF